MSGGAGADQYDTESLPHSTREPDGVLVEDAGKRVAVITPKSVFTRSGAVYKVSDATTKAVDGSRRRAVAGEKAPVRARACTR